MNLTMKATVELFCRVNARCNYKHTHVQRNNQNETLQWRWLIAILNYQAQWTRELVPSTRLIQNKLHRERESVHELINFRQRLVEKVRNGSHNG
jgi:hypothetical protein